MDEMISDRRKKLQRIRRFPTLASLRRELIRVYVECREAGPDPMKVQHFRALTFILGAAADVMKNEKLDGLEERLAKLESKGDTK